MLELKNIEKSYRAGVNKQVVLKGINVKFRRNEFTSILGTSGSGKTTLLNIIGGLDKYDSGDLIIDGISTKNYKDSDWDSYRNYRVGFIFQSYNLIMHQSVLQNVEIALTLSGISKSERKKIATEALEKVGLKEHINKKPNQLSGGQMQRVAIARALVNNPEIILADEPTGALDSETSIQIMDLLKEISSDRLVIMVTHNPELAKKYSTRIIELKDGLIISDNNPFNGNEEKKKEKNIKKTSMSLLSALSLSFNNLKTKKGRTILTAIAGSIGIIGIALIMSLSNGVNRYAKNLEKDSLSDFPISIKKVDYDLFGSISVLIEEGKKNSECANGDICSTDDLVIETVVSADKGLVQKNNVQAFMKYVESKEEFKKYLDSIILNYNFDLQVYTKDYLKVNPSNLVQNGTNAIFNELSIKKDSYKVLKGKMPESNNEVVLVIGNNNTINDSILYSLNIKDRNLLIDDLNKIRKDNKYRVDSSIYSYDDFIDREYKLILNTDYYKEENSSFVDYSDNKEYMNNIIDNGETLKIVGVVKDENASSSYIGFLHDLKNEIIEKISKTSIYKKQIENKKVNVLTNEEFDDITNSYEMIAEKLGIYEIDNPSELNIYPKDYDSKQKITKLIDKYNEEKKANNEDDLVINYSDLMKSLVSGISKVVNIISYVLIGFVAISLIVSSIMIGIITYISVLERTKEIGILRSIGASKKDIKRVFRAETIIEGFAAGTLGILIALLLSLPINLIVNMVGKIDKIAKLPLGSAIILIILSILLNVIAGSRPSSLAAKKNPVEALRTE